MTEGLAVLVGAVLVAACGSSLSTPGDGGHGGAGGQIGTGGGTAGGTAGSTGMIAAGGATGAGGTGGMLASGGAGGSLVFCGSALGGRNGLGGTNGLDASADAACEPTPLGGCPGPADSPCGPGAFCAESTQDGRADILTCLPVPSGCQSCSCMQEALFEFAKKFPNIVVPSYFCSCYDGQERVDGGTPADPIVKVWCMGA